MSVAEAFGRLMDAHRTLGSRVPDCLRPGVSHEEVDDAEEALGFSLHPDVRALFAFADGLDQAAWPPDWWSFPQIVPEVDFEPLAKAVESTLGWRRVAREFPEAPDMWGETWFALFPIHGDQAVVVDCEGSRGEPGTVWMVWWEADWIYPTATDLVSYLDQCTAAVRDNHTGVDPRTGWLTPRGEERSVYPNEDLSPPRP